jgi:VCBS repeat protein
MRNTKHLLGVLSLCFIASTSFAGAAERRTAAAPAGLAAEPTTPLPAAPSGDFNLDGIPDILWQHASRGLLEVWVMGANFKPHHSEPIAETGDLRIHASGTADFDGDGQTDVLLWNSSTGEIYIWYMRGLEVQSKVRLAERIPDRFPVSVHDFDLDGSPDVLWQGKGGDIIATIVRGGRIVDKLQVSVTTPGPAELWLVKGSGDVDFDGDHDLIVEKAQFGPPSPNADQGKVIGIVRMQKTNGVVEPLAIQPDFNWKVGAVADYDRDGDVDILWENDALGSTAVWVMASSKVQEMAVMTGPSTVKPAFEMVGPR